MSLVSFELFIDTALKKRQICYRAVSKLPETENRIEKLPLVHFLLLFLVLPDQCKMTLFLDHIGLSQPMPKILS